ncbi:DUF2878 domain-containing protein [Photobacterium marinum]|nr:DUF2878 domain-containing protein [Photobacterium marinum]
MSHRAESDNDDTDFGGVMPFRELLAVGTTFNLYWFIAVLGQGDWVWLLAIMLLVCWCLYRDTWRFAAMIAAFGMTLDYLLIEMGVFRFDYPFLPVWLAMLWLGFGSFVWVIRHVIASYSPLLIILIGGVGGAMSYLAGYRLGAVDLPLGILTTIPVVLIIWTIFTAFILLFLQRCDKAQREFSQEEEV